MDFSTITAQLNTKLSSGAVPSGFVDLSTVTTALAGKLSTTGVAAAVASGGVDFSTITTALNAKQTAGAAETTSSLTVTGSSMSVGTSAFYVYASSTGINTAAPKATLDVNGAIASTAVLVTSKYLIAFTSVPVFNACTTISTATLKSGATVMAMVLDSAVTIRRVTSMVQVAGVGGSGDTVTCDASGTGSVSATASAAAAAGTITSTSGSVNVPAGTNLQCYIMSAATTKPTLGLCVGYTMQ